MTCSEVNVYLDRMHHQDLAALPEAVRRHLENCAACRALWEFLTKRESSPENSHELRSRIERAILGSLKPVRPLPPAVSLTVGFLLIFTALSAVFIGLVGARGMAGMGTVQFAGLLGVIGATVLVLAVTLSREMVPGEKKVLPPGRMFWIIVVSLFAAVALLFPWELGRSFLPMSGRCFRAGFLMTLPTAGLIVLLLRRGAVLSLGMAGAVAGLLAGLVGATVLHFGCELNTAPHVALSHVGVALAAALAGYLIGRFLPEIRGRLRSQEE